MTSFYAGLPTEQEIDSLLKAYCSSQVKQLEVVLMLFCAHNLNVVTRERVLIVKLEHGGSSTPLLEQSVVELVPVIVSFNVSDLQHVNL